MTESKNRKSVNCPTCQTEVVWEESSEFRPFCSKRCQLIDFGEWAAEKHSIAGEPFYPVDDEDDSEPLQ